jgi:ribosome maturation factor RimP
MSLLETIKKVTEESILETDVYLVDIQVSESKIRQKITIFLDTDDGIQIDKCGEISRIIGNKLEELVDSAFTLEVSSPGADTPIKLPRQYKKNLGRTLKIVLNNAEEIKGELLNINDLELEVQPEKKKKIVPEIVKININEIKVAKAVISFK